MIRPPLRRRLAASRSALNVPLRLTFTWRSKAASSVSAMLDSCIIPALFDQHVDTAERSLGRIEHAADGLRIAHVGFGGHRSATLALDFARQRLGGGGVARIVDDDGKAVTGQPFRHRRADTARGTGDDRYLVSISGHFQYPHHCSLGEGPDAEIQTETLAEMTVKSIFRYNPKNAKILAPADPG